ncbi:hypothetical protein BUALT_Bualt10G0086200 [Buddleja alternifolia]|uniref:Uncharacterized protein n=1 Tax=Buddleja alternifolia TaxID=168488 RepID=A0AAV6X5S5_9LAMI|nr:hypothetical protein BUALT_Bualt10G0086200 [Buddleja alternifolia]
MAALKLFVFTVFLSLIFTNIRVNADASISDVDDEVKVVRSDGPDSAVLEQLKSKILVKHVNLFHWVVYVMNNGMMYLLSFVPSFSSVLLHFFLIYQESHIKEKSLETKEKDELIAAKEKIIKEKSDNILSLKSDVTSLQGKLDVIEQVGKTHAKAGELEKQVEKLKKEADLKIKEKELLEARATEAGKKVSELSSKFESLQKIIDEQKTKLRKTERALQIAEEELMKAKFEATSKTKELMEVHGAWLPPWLAVHCIHYQSLLEKNWKVHGKPALETLVQKASAIEKKAQVEEWAAPHMETVKTKWVPAMKEQWVVITTNVEPHVRTLTAKTIEIYDASKNAVTPHIIKVQELVDPYYQELRKVSNPYIDQVATATRPHVDKLRTALRPYTQEVVLAYGKFLESATTYHHQVQDKVQEKLNSHELTKPLATKELVWFSASAVLAFPIIFLLKICSAVFGTKPRKPVRNGNSNNTRRKGKRVHADK